MALRVGVVGLGQRGLQHLSVLWRLQSEGLVRVAALVDVFPENLAAAKIASYVPGFRVDGIRLSTDFADALGASLDALYIALPPGLHGGEVIAGAEAGVHLFIEKPVSLYLDEAAPMDAAIRKSGVIAAVGFQHRYDARNEAVRGFLADKRIVLLTMASHSSLESHSVKHTATERLGGPGNRVWTANAQWSGSTVVEAGIHQVDLMRYWCGDIEWVSARYVHRDADDIVDGADNPYAYAATFGFANGAVGSLILSRLRRVYFGDGHQSVLWTHGHLRFEGAELAAYYYDGPYPPEQTPDRAAVRHVVPVPRGIEATEGAHRAFLHAVSTRNPDQLRSPFSASMNSLDAVIGANVSDHLGGERVALAELASHDRFADFRRKPPRPA